MSFIDRLAKAEAFEAKLKPKLEEMGLVVAPNASERTHGAFMDELRGSRDPSALALRFLPDFVAHTQENPPLLVLYIDAKAAKNIERDAYEQYLRLTTIGYKIVLIFEPYKWAWNLVQEIGLRRGEVTVSQYRPERRLPVKDGWITPRGDRLWDSLLRASNPQASGTPYREVLRSSLHPWNEFYSRLLRPQQLALWA